MVGNDSVVQVQQNNAPRTPTGGKGSTAYAVCVICRNLRKCAEHGPGKVCFGCAIWLGERRPHYGRRKNEQDR